jgi:ATP-dependent Lon protease
MKNIIIADNNTHNQQKNKLENTIHYFHELIQKTIIAIQKYKQYDVLGANELNIATQSLESHYIDLTNNYAMLKKKDNIKTVSSNITEIRNNLNNIFRLYGTESIQDLLNVCFGDNYVNNIKWDNNKYILLEKYFHPSSFKTIPWNNTTVHGKKGIEKNKLVEDFVIAESSDNLECFDLSRTSDIFQSKVYGIKIAFHNKKDKKTIIVSGLLDDLLTTCINNEYVLKKISAINKKSKIDKDCESKTFTRYLHSLTLKEIIVYSDDEIINKYHGHMNQVVLIKQKNISQVVKEFMNSDLYGQRNTLIQLLLKSDDHEYQYLAYLLYDLLSTDTNGSIDTTEQTLLFDSLPWKIKSFFKEAMKETIDYTNNLSNFDNNKIPLEQQICLMKADDNVKERAMNKLKEIKSKTDDTGSKARTYLDGLLKIPFGMYKKEPVLNIMDTIKRRFSLLVEKINNMADSSSLNIDLNNITNIQIKNTCEKIKGMYLNNNNDKFTEIVIKNYTPDKRNELILNICNINTIIKCHKLKRHKLVHSGKKIEFMKNAIIEFINSISDNTPIVEELYKLKNMSNVATIQGISDDITFIESNWNNINDYMNNVKDTLDNAVHGHEKAKTQIQRILAQWINGEQSGYCFGFEGPPGTGKTTLAKKGLANCLVDDENVSRPFSFIAIGGQDNGSTLNGHNYTYVGSEWGKFVDILIKNKCMNPIIFIDELDKVSKTEHGKEIIGILTHLIDPTQNDIFQDKYFNGIDIDLSKALFVFSYNDVSAIDKILLDRIHRIKFGHLTIEDKLVVTKRHILPEIYKNMGLVDCIDLTDDNIIYIVENYTNEPGIRKFKELLFEIIGEINLSCLKNYNTTELPIIVSNHDIKYKYLKSYHMNNYVKIPHQDMCGTINGLWANSMGQGGIIQIESRFFPSTSFMELKLTGLQGDVMKESMTVAKTLACSLVDTETMTKNIEQFEKTKIQGIHIHCPEGAVPKDGPSAGTAITCSIYSLLINKKIKKNIAITGEINLQGRVTAIGGLDLKILGGIKGGVTEFIFPCENQKDYDEVIELYKDKDIMNGIKFHPVGHISEVLELIF